MFNVAEYALFNESLCHTEGEHGEVVVLLSTVAELVDVSLEGLDDVARRLRSGRRHQLEDARSSPYCCFWRFSASLRPSL